MTDRMEKGVHSGLRKEERKTMGTPDLKTERLTDKEMWERLESDRRNAINSLALATPNGTFDPIALTGAGLILPAGILTDMWMGEGWTEEGFEDRREASRRADKRTVQGRSESRNDLNTGVADQQDTQCQGGIWAYARSIEQRFSRVQDEYELRISRAQDEIFQLKSQMSNNATSTELAHFKNEKAIGENDDTDPSIRIAKTHPRTASRPIIPPNRHAPWASDRVAEGDRMVQNDDLGPFVRHASNTPSIAASHPLQSIALQKQDSFRSLVTRKPTQFEDKVAMRENRLHADNEFLRKEIRKRRGARDLRADEPAEVQKRRRLDLDPEKPRKPTVFAGRIPLPDTGVSTAWRSMSEASSSPLYASDDKVAIMGLAKRNHPQSIQHVELSAALIPRPAVDGELSMLRDHHAEIAEIAMAQCLKDLTDSWMRGCVFEWTKGRIEGSIQASQGKILGELNDSDATSHIIGNSAVSPEGPTRKTASLERPQDPSNIVDEWTGSEVANLVSTITPRPSHAAMMFGVEDLEPRVYLQEETAYHTTSTRPDVSINILARATRPKDSAALASGMVIEKNMAAERAFLDLPSHGRSSGSSMREVLGSGIPDHQATQGQDDIWTGFKQRYCRTEVSSRMLDRFKDLQANANLQDVAVEQALGVGLQDMTSGFTKRAFMDLPQADFQALRATTEPMTQDRVQHNPFRRRLEQLVEYLACEVDKTPSSTSSSTDSDDASNRSDHANGHNGYRYHDGAPNSDSPDSVNDSRSNRQRSSESTGKTSCDQPSGSSRKIPVSGPIQDYEDDGVVRTDVRQFQNNQETGKVIPCPLSQELKCAGMDENMSSLLRELSNSTHNIFYCNRCKSLLSRIDRTGDGELLRRLRKENKERWQVHIKSCHDGHCVMHACAPDPHGEVRHKHNENCKTNREDEKAADAKYLYRKLGIAEQGIEIGIRIDHKGKRRSTARKIVRVAEDATQRNVELESDIRDRDQELEMLREADRKHRGDIRELKSSNEELCSIIRHALEDMQREKVCLTNALHDRIKRHAPSALISYIARSQSQASVSYQPEGAPHNGDQSSQGPFGTVHEWTDTFESMPASVPTTRQHNSARVDTCLLTRPTAKRQRREVPTCDDDWICQLSILPKPLNESADFIPKDVIGAAPISTPSFLASGPTDVRDAVGFESAEPLTRQISQCDVVPWQQDFQHASMSWMYNDNDLPFSCAFLGGDVQPKSPAYHFEFNPRHSMVESGPPQS